MPLSSHGTPTTNEGTGGDRQRAEARLGRLTRSVLPARTLARHPRKSADLLPRHPSCARVHRRQPHAPVCLLALVAPLVQIPERLPPLLLALNDRSGCRDLLAISPGRTSSTSHTTILPTDLTTWQVCCPPSAAPERCNGNVQGATKLHPPGEVFVTHRSKSREEDASRLFEPGCAGAGGHPGPLLPPSAALRLPLDPRAAAG